MAAKLACDSDSNPAIPVMTVIEQKITAYTTPVVNSSTQKSSKKDATPTQMKRMAAQARTRVPMVIAGVRRLAAGAGGGGSTPANGSFCSLVVRSPGQNSSSRNSARNGRDGLRPVDSRLDGSRYLFSSW